MASTELAQSCASRYLLYRFSGYEISRAKSFQAINDISLVQEKLHDSVAFVLKASKQLPADIIITKYHFSIVTRALGEGGQGTTYVAEKFFRAEFGNFSSEEVALKLTDFSLERERTLLHEFLYPNDFKDTRLNFCREVFEVYGSKGKKNVGFLQLMEGDLTQIDYTKIEDPASFILPILYNVASGLEVLEKSGIIHRDVKGPNMFYDEDGHGAVGDMGYIDSYDPKRNEKGPICGTPGYLAPFTYETLSDQIERVGYQTPAGDVYAFGIMLQDDVLGKMILQFGKKYGVKVDEYRRTIMSRIISKTSKKRFSNESVVIEKVEPEEISNLAKKFQRSRRLVYYSSEKELRFIPEAKKYLEIVKTVLNRFEGDLDSSELKGLLDLARLAYCFQIAPQEKLTFTNVCEVLGNFFSEGESSGDDEAIDPSAASSSNS